MSDQLNLRTRAVDRSPARTPGASKSVTTSAGSRLARTAVIASASRVAHDEQRTETSTVYTQRSFSHTTNAAAAAASGGGGGSGGSVAAAAGVSSASSIVYRDSSYTPAQSRRSLLQHNLGQLSPPTPNESDESDTSSISESWEAGLSRNGSSIGEDPQDDHGQHQQRPVHSDRSSMLLPKPLYWILVWSYFLASWQLVFDILVLRAGKRVSMWLFFMGMVLLAIYIGWALPTPPPTPSIGSPSPPTADSTLDDVPVFNATASLSSIVALPTDAPVSCLPPPPPPPLPSASHSNAACSKSDLIHLLSSLSESEWTQLLPIKVLQSLSSPASEDVDQIDGSELLQKDQQLMDQVQAIFNNTLATAIVELQKSLYTELQSFKSEVVEEVEANIADLKEESYAKMTVMLKNGFDEVTSEMNPSATPSLQFSEFRKRLILTFAQNAAVKQAFAIVDAAILNIVPASNISAMISAAVLEVQDAFASQLLALQEDLSQMQSTFSSERAALYQEISKVYANISLETSRQATQSSVKFSIEKEMDSFRKQLAKMQLDSELLADTQKRKFEKLQTNSSAAFALHQAELSKLQHSFSLFQDQMIQMKARDEELKFVRLAVEEMREMVSLLKGADGDSLAPLQSKLESVQTQLDRVAASIELVKVDGAKTMQQAADAQQTAKQSLTATDKLVGELVLLEGQAKDASTLALEAKSLALEALNQSVYIDSRISSVNVTLDAFAQNASIHTEAATARAVSLAEHAHHVANLSLALISNHTAKQLSIEEVQQLVDLTLHTYDADKTGLADYAMQSIGGSIVDSCTSPSMLVPWLNLGFTSLGKSSAPPAIILQAVTGPGDCWAFNGSTGHVTIRLPSPVFITNFTIEHISPALVPSIDSAPRQIHVYGISDSCHAAGDFLAAHEFKPLGTTNHPSYLHHVQTFGTATRTHAKFRYVRLEILNNHGAAYTCLYRFRVHGHL